MFVVHIGFHFGGHEADVVHGLHIPVGLGLVGLDYTAHHLTLYTAGSRYQDRQQQKIKTH